jgi:DNA-directed RNA polymerase subunit RPC12/RpoP
MSEENLSITNTFKCANCGAELTYAPGTSSLTCKYCGVENKIEHSDQPVTVEENDYSKVLSEIESRDQHYQVHTVKCQTCGSSTTLDPNVTSDNCPYCDTPLVVENAATASFIKPKYLLPFKCDRNEARRAFQTWVQKLWFAPDTLKKYAVADGKLSGLYVPYWTYDSDTFSTYTGERGTNHTEHYTVRVNGKNERRSRTVIHWRHVNGSVQHSFDDVLVIASTSLPEKYANKLEPWDLTNLSEYNEAFISGYRSETYQIGLDGGFEKARGIMDIEIRNDIKRDIGGDHQRIHAVNTSYSNITFKHILLPVWISAYRYKEKTFQFLVNGRTGEVQGERPWSWVKISLAVIGASALIGTALYFLQPYFN